MNLVGKWKSSRSDDTITLEKHPFGNDTYYFQKNISESEVVLILFSKLTNEGIIGEGIIRFTERPNHPIAQIIVHDHNSIEVTENGLTLNLIKSLVTE